MTNESSVLHKRLSDSDINAAWRERARLRLLYILRLSDRTIEVNRYGSVQPCEGGAWVECSLWVPDPPLDAGSSTDGRREAATVRTNQPPLPTHALWSEGDRELAERIACGTIIATSVWSNREG